MGTVLILNKDQMGVGDEDLGRKILATFFRKSIVLEDLQSVVFYNNGVKLLVADSPVRSELTLLEERGVDLLPCGTCVEHYGIALAISEVSSMDDILKEISRASKVVTL